MTDELTSFNNRRRRRKSPKTTTPEPVASVEEPKVPKKKVSKPRAIQPEITTTSVKPAAPVKEGAAEVRNRQIAPFLTLNTIRRIETAIDAAQNAGDYRYENVPSVVRTAILTFLDGDLKMAAKPKAGDKKRVGVLLTAGEYERYESKFIQYPRKRAEVTERIVVSFLANSLNPETEN